MNKIINGNVIRALQRIKLSPTDAEHLVEEEYIDALFQLLSTQETVEETFDLKTEFRNQYGLVKAKMTTMGDIQSKEDLDILKEAQKFLSFMLRNEEKLTEIQAVKDFKEAVLTTLDEESPELRDRIIRRLSSE